MAQFSGPREWGRLLTAMLTPFDQNGRLNESEFVRIAQYLVDVQKNDGLVICGTTGEAPTLTHEEKELSLRLALDAVGDRAAIIFGSGTNNTADSLELTRMAERVGAHGIMLVNPYYNRPGQEGLFAHFSAVAQTTSLPVMLYNIQGRSAINLETSTLLRLAEIPNIVAVKEASGNIAQISDVCGQCGDNLRVYSGDDAMTLPIMSVGGYGLVSVAAHVIGPELKSIIANFSSTPSKSRETHHKVVPLIKALFSAPSPVPVKYALSMRGFDCQSVRLPLVELSAAEKQIVDRADDPFRQLQ
ncbi:MAG: 4-hydroxy-tetrahydrodipicolinate synthase [Armatimonadetes bacterium]|nr:4-hydroxy-tetrahydrodipicolinate synthase [Armatimonadota bacterium]